MNNSEILYLYDAKLTNPNGDPDEENRPRMDYEREINLVSDLRLKRYIRDYLLSRDYELFVMKMDGKPVTADKRTKALKSFDDDTILDTLIDVRMFGATMTVKGDNKTFIGPIQFNWGYSLNKVELLESSITSHFSTGENKTKGAIGKDYRVKYSLIAFSGVVSGKRGKKTKLTQEDVELLDEAMKNAIPELVTRSKIGQYPRLYMRVEYKDDETILGDLRDYISLEQSEDSIRDIRECTLEIGELIGFINKNKDRIKCISYYYDERFKLSLNGESVEFKEAFSNIDLKEI